CNHSRNERFAEVFAAYVTYPELLQERCPQDFEYFSRNVFPGTGDSPQMAWCNRPTQSEIRTRIPAARPAPTTTYEEVQ
ncbi:MAG: hypothetical protein AAF202_10355, partial [Pseudomonadota bacterium]